MIKRFAQYEDVLISDKPTEVVKFGEYRKGSAKYGPMIDSIMMWVRNYKEGGDKLKRLEVKLNKFLKETNTDIETLKSFIQEKDKTNLISFDIKIEGDKIIIDNLNQKVKSLPWEAKDI